MNELLIKEPVSSCLPEFHQLVTEHLEAQEIVIILLRYSRAGGSRDYFIVRSPSEFEIVLNRALRGTAITVFFESNFKLKGRVNSQVCEQAIALLQEFTEDEEEVAFVRLDCFHVELDEEQYLYFTDAESIREWCTKNTGVPVLMGRLGFWVDNCPDVITVYVPGADGIVRPGAY